MKTHFITALNSNVAEHPITSNETRLKYLGILQYFSNEHLSEDFARILISI